MKPQSSTINNNSAKPIHPYSIRRIRIGLILTLLGFAIFLLGARPSIYGLDRSPIIGFVQIAVFLVGLAIMCIGGYTSLMALWKDRVPSIAVDIGQRMVVTGYVVSVFAGMADVFGFGSHPLPGVPYFGGLQALGVLIGQIVIIIGFLLLIPYPQSHKTDKTLEDHDHK
jgi:hypothetical protein